VHYLLLSACNYDYYDSLAHLCNHQPSERWEPLLGINVQRDGHVEVDVAHAELELCLVSLSLTNNWRRTPPALLQQTTVCWHCTWPDWQLCPTAPSATSRITARPTHPRCRPGCSNTASQSSTGCSVSSRSGDRARQGWPGGWTGEWCAPPGCWGSCLRPCLPGWQRQWRREGSERKGNAFFSEECKLP
jgi:hypothetical protein